LFGVCWSDEIFYSLHELVKDGRNGCIFKDAAQLARQLEVLPLLCIHVFAIASIFFAQSLLTSFPESAPLAALRSHFVVSEYRCSSPHMDEYGEWNTWEENWGKVVRPLLDIGTASGNLRHS
jgi:beta-1,4-mannosyltransferase